MTEKLLGPSETTSETILKPFRPLGLHSDQFSGAFRKPLELTSLSSLYFAAEISDFTTFS